MRTASGHQELDEDEEAASHHGAHPVFLSMATATQAFSHPRPKRPLCCLECLGV